MGTPAAKTILSNPPESVAPTIPFGEMGNGALIVNAPVGGVLPSLEVQAEGGASLIVAGKQEGGVSLEFAPFPEGIFPMLAEPQQGGVMATRVETPPPAYSSGENSPRGPEPIPGGEKTLLLGENQIAGGNLLELVKRVEALSGGLDRFYAGSSGGEVGGPRANPSLVGPQPEPLGGGDRAAPPLEIFDNPHLGHREA